jgi:hypothetical protein
MRRERPELVSRLWFSGLDRGSETQIRTAVVHHCQPLELDRAHPHWRLTSLLKDADGLDRVRLGELDQRYLRNPEAVQMSWFKALAGGPG